MWFLFSSSALAGEPTIGAVVRPEGWVDPVRDDTDGTGTPDLDENLYELHTWARAWVRGETPGLNKWFLEVRLQHHATVGVESTDTLVPEAWWELGVGESGWDGKLGGPFRLRVGALVERWGKLDLLPVADILNPRDLRVGAMVNNDFSRIPIPMAVFAIDGGSVRAETVYIPFATSDKLFTRDTDWSYMRQGYSEELLSEMSTWDGSEASVVRPSLDATRESLALMDAQFRRTLDTAFLTQGLPEAFGDGDIAERLEWSGRNADLAVFGGYFRSRQPELVLDPVLRTFISEHRLPDSPDEVTQLQNATAGGPLLSSWPRTGIVGLDGSALAGPLQFRLDGLYRTNQVVRRTYGDATTVPSIAAGLGVDWFQSSKFQVTAEGRFTHLEGAPANLMFAMPDQVQMGGGVRWIGAQERLTLQLGGVYDVSFGEGLVRPSAAWRFSDHVTAELTGLVIAGSTPAPECPVSTLNSDGSPGCTNDSFTYEGGVLSYFQTNDSIGLALQFSP